MKHKTNGSKTNGKQKRSPEKEDTEPGLTEDMIPPPEDTMAYYQGNYKLLDKVAIVTGGDSGIGRAVAIGMAKEGADIVIIYLSEDEDARETERRVTNEGRKALILRGDVGSETFCKKAIKEIMDEFGQIDILVNNAAEQHPHESIEDITEAELTNTFRTNIFSMFFLTKYALPHLGEGASIINTASVTAYKGSARLVDYSATKGAIISFTRSLSQSLIEKKIRVNAVAPGPIWTPLVASTFSPEEVQKFGSDVPMKRAGQPDEVAPAYIYLASNGSSYVTGQTIHVNGGTIVNG
jgi:NAD(P)-dependent dehydrogenase (short-subunit alcohol dehydrogenase family)